MLTGVSPAVRLPACRARPVGGPAWVRRTRGPTGPEGVERCQAPNIRPPAALDHGSQRMILWFGPAWHHHHLAALCSGASAPWSPMSPHATRGAPHIIATPTPASPPPTHAPRGRQRAYSGSKWPRKNRRRHGSRFGSERERHPVPGNLVRRDSHHHRVGRRRSGPPLWVRGVGDPAR